MSDQIKAEKPKKSKSKILGGLVAVGLGVWRLIVVLSSKDSKGQNKS